MNQTRWGSLRESLTNIAIGYAVNYMANLAIFPLFGFHISLKDNLLMGAIYTVISIARSYTIRRWFNWRLNKEHA